MEYLTGFNDSILNVLLRSSIMKVLVFSNTHFNHNIKELNFIH